MFDAVRHVFHYLDHCCFSKLLSFAILETSVSTDSSSLLSIFDQDDRFEQEVQQALLSLLKTGHCSIESLAKKLGCSKRSLQRSFELRNKSYSRVLAECRKKLAIEYLKDNQLSLTDIAFLLAYSEQSAFTRAFNAWFGTSPKNYRKNLIQQSFNERSAELK